VSQINNQKLVKKYKELKSGLRSSAQLKLTGRRKSC